MVLLKKISAVSALIVMFGAACFGDVVTLKSGFIFKGKLLEKTKETFRMETFKGEVKIPAGLVKKHEKTKSPYEIYNDEIRRMESVVYETADSREYDLGMFCVKNKIWHKAQFHLKKALEINKERGDAQKALVEMGKKWEDACAKSRYGFILNIGIPVDLTKEDIEKLLPVIRDCSKELARSTGGLLYFKEVIFTDNSSSGNMLYNPNGATAKNGLAAVPGGHNNFEHGPDNWHPVCIMHEFGHFMLNLADEYDTSIYGGAKVDPENVCPKCKMSFPQKQPGEDWCSSLNHPPGAGNAPGCQEVLLANFKRQCPLLPEAFNFSPEEILYPPEPKITINDTKLKTK